jgi:hypothetical protein
MTRKLSLITAVGVAALSVGAPAAFGKVHANAEIAPVLAQPNPLIEDGFAQAVAQVSTKGAETPGGKDIPRAILEAERMSGGDAAIATTGPIYRDAHESAVATNPVRSDVLEYRDSIERMALVKPDTSLGSVSTYRDAFERAVPPESVPVSATTSGRDIEWPQVGVGLGIGLLLALGLGLIMRTAHVRPFAH